LRALAQRHAVVKAAALDPIAAISSFQEQVLDHHALVRGRMGHVEIVRLRTSHRDLSPESSLYCRLAGCDTKMVLADSDDLDHAVQHLVEALDHDRRLLDGRRFQADEQVAART
jgi:hypothetical protein